MSFVFSSKNMLKIQNDNVEYVTKYKHNIYFLANSCKIVNILLL